MADATLGRWLFAFGIAKDLDEAENLCYSGSVRLNGITVTNAETIPAEGTILATLNTDYEYRIPDEGSLYLQTT